MTTEDQAIEGLAARLRTISGLNVFSSIPDAAPVYPSLFLDGPSVPDYTEDLGEGSITFTVRAVLIVSAATSANSKQLRPYTARAGDKSIYAVVRADRKLGTGGTDVEAGVLSSDDLNAVQFAMYQGYGRSFVIQITCAGSE